ncbi:MAG: GntR family transcriptional regulator [Actinopolymorphaceae bacterium]
MSTQVGTGTGVASPAAASATRRGADRAGPAVDVGGSPVVASGPAAQGAYTELADALRRGIYPEGSRLPGERDLAARLGVSRTTLRQALGRLAAEGLLQRASQRGWFVARRVVGEPPSVLQSFSEMARSRGLEPSSHILAQDVRPATFEEAERLRITPSSRVLEIRRVRGMDAVPVCLDTTILVAARAEALVAADLEDRSLYDALAELCGVAVARSSYAVQAAAAEHETARLLGIAEGSPVLVGQEVTYDSAEVPVLTSRTTYRGDAYRFQADLYRPLS